MLNLTRRSVALAAGIACAAALAAGALVATAAHAGEVGKAAPAFSAVDTNGVKRSLADLKGKIVVLEWTNADCPYVKKHYRNGDMQKLQKQAAADGVVWLSVISSAPGKQGHVDAAGANALSKSRDAAPAGVILDPAGEIGKAYGAKTTPHMYVIDSKGVLVYQGAIDDNASADSADIAGAKNHVAAALADVKAGRAVANPVTKSYGCSVKYDQKSS